MRYQTAMKIGLFGLLIGSLFFLTGCFGFFTDWFAPLPELPPEEPFAAPFDPEAIMVDPATGAEIVSNQVIVRFKDGVPRTTREALIAELGCIVVGRIPIRNTYQLKIPDGADPIDLAAQFENSPHVQRAGVNHIIRPFTLAVGSTSASEPNDPYFREQWALHNTGQTGGRVDADIDAPEAWVIEKGHPSVTIAILDTGVNYEHEDLEDNLRMPELALWDVVDWDASPMDEDGHGTAMTGIAVAGMNEKGIVGVAPYATFLPVRILGEGGTDLSLSLAILQAYERGNARIFNMSFGYPWPREVWENTWTRDEIRHLIVESGDKVLFIAGAGNDGSSELFYPAADLFVMAVAATDHNDQKSDWGGWNNASNYGFWVDVSAPGGSGGFWPWDPNEERIRSTAAFPGNNSYGWTGGTSAATAFVSGVATLIWSLDYRTGGGFDLSASEVRDIIKASADNIDHLNPGYGGKLGAGRVNAHKALLEAKRRLGLPVDHEVTFPDPNLERAIRWRINKPSGPILRSDLLGLTSLDESGENISDLTGIEYLTNLTRLWLWSNQITDLTPLAGLVNLTVLGLNWNRITDITPLAGLTNLIELRLLGNRITDITPLAGLTNLTELWFGHDQITDITPLAGLTNLTVLLIWGNQISDITPLAGLTNLTDLNLWGNQISDITPLAGLTNLTDLTLGGNQIGDITPLAGLTNLAWLMLGGNQIGDITPLAGLTNLTELILWGNQISDITPLAGLTNLTELGLYGNQISDITPLARLINLTWLGLGGNQITDITPLAGLTNLTVLGLHENQISDLAPLVANTGLGAGDEVRLHGNPLDLTPGSPNMRDIEELRRRGVSVFL